MRFEVDQIVLLVGLKFSDATGRRWDSDVTFRVPQTDHIINEIKFVESTVKEHHKVPGDWDDEKKYDGFIFDVQGCRGLNQYPKASYGQISDTQDRVISIAEYLYETKYNEDYDAMAEANEISCFTTAGNLFDTIDGGIKFFTDRGDTTLADALKKQREQVLGALNEQFPQYKVVRKEIWEGSNIYSTEVIKESTCG